MADRKTTSVDELYANRHRPYGQVRDGSHRRIEHEPSLEPKRGGAFNSNVVQDPENRHDVRYDNTVADDWRRGGGKGGATGKPGFDFGASYRRKDGGDRTPRPRRTRSSSSNPSRSGRTPSKCERVEP
jgi:hypothetical protein